MLILIRKIGNNAIVLYPVLEEKLRFIKVLCGTYDVKFEVFQIYNYIKELHLP